MLSIYFAVTTWIAFIAILPNVVAQAASNDSASNHTTNNNIIIQNHNDTKIWWVAFRLWDVNYSCGGDIVNVEITDNNNYAGEWVNFDPFDAEYGLYSYDQQDDLPYTTPISVRITMTVDNINSTLIGHNVITALTPLTEFDFGSNFCQQSISKQWVTQKTTIQISYTIILESSIVILCIFAFIAWIDAAYIRRNDYFQKMAVIKAMFQIQDMLSDIFFALEVFDTYRSTTEYQQEFFFILIASIIFIIFPISLSLYQLNKASHKYWLKDDHVRHWLGSYAQLLYIVSIFSGSSFTAVHLFNSNLFGLDIFDMGLSRKYILSWNTKKLLSIGLFENCPQLLLSICYTLLLGELTLIPVAQMVFSVISVSTGIMAMFLEKQIYFTQDVVFISIDITGQCIVDNLGICRTQIKQIQYYISQFVLGVNVKLVDIQKPVSIPRGIQMRIYVSHVGDNVVINDPASDFHDSLHEAVEQGEFQQNLKDAWNLSEAPSINNIDCVFIKSKERTQSEIEKGKIIDIDDVEENVMTPFSDK